MRSNLRAVILTRPQRRVAPSGESCGSMSCWLIARQKRRSEIMFTGLIEEVGSVLGVAATHQGTQLQIVAPRIADKIQMGDSIAVNGCCLTVAAHRGDRLTLDLLEETRDRTNLGTLRLESRVNLERALAANARVVGHFVQGHVDCTARIVALEQDRANQRIEIELPAEFAHYI